MHSAGRRGLREGHTGEGKNLATPPLLARDAVASVLLVGMQRGEREAEHESFFRCALCSTTRTLRATKVRRWTQQLTHEAYAGLHSGESLADERTSEQTRMTALKE